LKGVRGPGVERGKATRLCETNGADGAVAKWREDQGRNVERCPVESANVEVLVRNKEPV